MEDQLNWEQKNPIHKNADMFVLFILTHGARGAVFGTDGVEQSIDSITSIFDSKQCPALKNKPKLFFIQACQGGQSRILILLVHHFHARDIFLT